MVKTLIYWFSTILLISSVLAEVPSFIPICGRRNPKLNECIIKSTQAVIPKLIEGIPELDVPPMEPLLLPDGLPVANSPDLKANTKNVKLWHALDFKAKDSVVDLDKKFFTYSVHFDKMKIEGDYTIAAKVIVPINGAGSIVFDVEDIDANFTMRYKLINTKKGQQMYFTSMTCQIKLKDFKGKFTPKDTTSATLSDAIHTVIHSNRQEVVETVTPTLERAISATVLDFANRICQNFTYDELFPDRE